MTAPQSVNAPQAMTAVDLTKARTATATATTCKSHTNCFSIQGHGLGPSGGGSAEGMAPTTTTLWSSSTRGLHTTGANALAEDVRDRCVNKMNGGTIVGTRVRHFKLDL